MTLLILWYGLNSCLYDVVRVDFFFLLLGHHTVNQTSRDDRLQTDEAEHAISQDE